MAIRQLSEGIINRIAAGEVIERPASVVKELVENALDATATQIDVIFRGGGKSLIRVSDNGFGIKASDIELAVSRHATSKLPEDDLTNIQTLGFRGEALPSIASVSRMVISSRYQNYAEAFSLCINGGAKQALKPASLQQGTEIDVQDLFYATPARFKFLKTDRTEVAEALDVMRRLALAQPQVGFSFTTEERRLLDVGPTTAQAQRISQVMGKEFFENAQEFSATREDVSLHGFAGLPTYSRAQSNMQFVFVNGRPVRDKLLAGAIRGAYADVMARGRFPAIVLMVTCAPSRVDVNVHPAKSEVRFRDGGMIRSLIVTAVRAAFGQNLSSSSHMAGATLAQFRAGGPPQAGGADPLKAGQPQSTSARWYGEEGGQQLRAGFFESQQALAINTPPATPASDHQPVAQNYPLGAALAQLHENYIISQTHTGLVVVDQHAAHERLVYERLKQEHASEGISIQPFLVPQVVELGSIEHERLLAAQTILHGAGLEIEAFGAGALLVRAMPAMLAQADIAPLLKDIADELSEQEVSNKIEERIHHILATMACHYSVRSGRKLRVEEMNQLLRDMENTPNSGQCNHGRPTFVELKLSDIERLFGRR